MPPTATAKKNKGCFQCSRRRIICDRTEPSCLKCAKKGIECSGLGRIRFAEGVARRGRFKDCKVPTAGGNNGCQQLPTTTGFQALRWPGEEKEKKRRKVNDNDGVTDNTHLTPMPNVPLTRIRGEEDSLPPVSGPAEVVRADDDEEVEEIGRGRDELIAAHTESFDIAPWIAPIDPKLRMLFSYCKSP